MQGLVRQPWGSCTTTSTHKSYLPGAGSPTLLRPLKLSTACKTAAKEPSTINTAPSSYNGTASPESQAIASSTATSTAPAQQRQQTSSREQTAQQSGSTPASSTASSKSVAGVAGTGTGTGSSSSSKPPKPPKAPQWMAPTAAISVSGPYLTTSSIDGDSLIMSAEFLERELVGPYKFAKHQLDIIHELSEGMKGCSTAFIAVAAAGIALSVAASSGMDLDDAPEVLFNGVTVGDVASWVDSLLVAYLLRFGASSFSRVESTTHEERQLAYTFQGINRLGLMFTQFSIAATTVSIVSTLEAASKWPPLVTLASGLFFMAAVGRSTAMWYVLNKYGTTLDDVEGALEAQRRAYAAAHDEELPLFDRLAIRLAFSYLLQYSAAGRRPSAAALSSAADTVMAAYSGNSSAAVADADEAADASSSDSEPRGIFATTAAVAKRAGGRSAEAASEAARKGMEILQKIPLPILSRSTDDQEATASTDSSDQQAGQQQQQQYVLTQAEERLVQACQSSLNTAGLALIMQTVATGLLVTACIANEDYSGALGDGIQVVNKAIAAELIFVATTNFDQALYTEGCDVEHLLEGLGERGITKLFHNLSILAWATVIAKGVELLAPWEEHSPLFKFIGENFSHQAADMVLEGQELLINVLK